MPNLKASKKALRQSEKHKIQNDRIRRRYRNAIKSFITQVESGDTTGAQESLPKVYKMLDKAAKSGVIKDTTAARKKSRLVKKLNRLSAPDVETTSKDS